MTAVATNGVDISAPSGPMVLCPDASGSGQLTQRYPSANQVTLWVNGILDRLIPDRQPGFTSQGLKAIMLSWASKAGVDEYDRHVLGGHSMKGRQTAATYARDTLTAPVKRLEEVITSVRHGSFLPDSSRSNMFRSSKKDDKLDSDARGCTDVVIPTSSETGGSTNQQTGSNADGRGDARVVSQDDVVDVDSDSSTSSSSDDAPQDEVAELCMSQSPLQIQLEKFHWKEHCSIYKHVRTHKLHLKALGSETGTFLCGRMISDDYREFSGTIAEVQTV